MNKNNSPFKSGVRTSKMATRSQKPMVSKIKKPVKVEKENPVSASNAVLGEDSFILD